VPLLDNIANDHKTLLLTYVCNIRNLTLPKPWALAKDVPVAKDGEKGLLAEDFVDLYHILSDS